MMNLDWVIENRTVPWEITNVLQQLADRHQYTVDQMHQHKSAIIKELEQTGKGYIVKVLFPEGLKNDEQWLHALIRMEIRRLKKIEKGG